MALDPARNPDDIGGAPGDRRKMTAAQLLQVLLAQRGDPYRDPGSTPELEGEIARMQRVVASGAQPAVPGGPRVVEFEGQQHSFPADATDEEITAALASLHPAPQAPRASQADVRAAEPVLSPMTEQRENERIFEGATGRYMKSTGHTGLDISPSTEPSALPPNEFFPGRRAAPGGVRQQVEQATGLTDPSKTREQAGIEELRQGGEVAYGDSVPYVASKALAALGGFAVGGPAGATAGESAVRLTALAFNLKKAVDAGAIDQDRAAELMAKEMASGTGEDALFNFGVPLVGQIAAKIPGMSWLGDKVAKALAAKGLQAGKGLTGEAAQRAGAVAKRAAEAQTPEAKRAVEELSKRTGGDVIPTPGQVTGESSYAENVSRMAHPSVYEKAQAPLEQAAADMRSGLVNPPKQPSRQQLGQGITDAAEKLQQAVKDRLRPAFDAADNLGVKVDMNDVLTAAKAALAKDAAVPGGRLAASERAGLEGLIADLEKQPFVSPEAALDFVSRQKEKLRAVTADYKPSKYFDTVTNQITKAADHAYAQAAASAGRSDVVKNLLLAQHDYRDMMSTVYDDAVKQALRKNPEDVGRLFWQAGNVSEIQQLHKMLQMSVKEGSMGPGKAAKLQGDMARGFLQEAVPTVGAASKWSETLAAKPGLRDTWNTLTSAPGGMALRDGMKVLEEAAKIAGRGNPELLGESSILWQRAARGGLGVSYVTGVIHPGFAAAGFSVDAITRMMATAYTRGDKGVANLLMRALRANGAGTAAGAKALQALLPEIEQTAAKYGIEDVFVGQ